MSGFIYLTIDKAIKAIKAINIQGRYQEELKHLKELVKSIEDTMKQIQHYRLLITWKKDSRPAPNDRDSRDSESDVWVKEFNKWLDQLDAYLQEASEVAQNSAVSTHQVILRDEMSETITKLTAEIARHLQSMSSLIDKARAEGIVADSRHITPAKGKDADSRHITPATSSFGLRDILAPSKTSTAISTVRMESMDKQQKSLEALERMKLMDETLKDLVGQQNTLESLEILLTDQEWLTTKRIGVLGKGGSGKTLLLKRLFNSEKVRNCFSGGFLLWLTVSQSPSFPSLRNKLWTQIKIQDKVGAVKNINEQHVEIWIAIQNNVDAIKNTEEEEVKKWVKEALQQSSGFVLFLDDVWESNVENLLNKLGIQQETVTNNPNSKVIVSSRDRVALSNMKIVEVKDLNENDSWNLFTHLAFPNNIRNPPGKEEGKLLCQMCQGLPLAIKVVGKAMAGSTDRKQWRWALQRLSNDKSVYDCRLRFGFEALGNEGVKVQCCFLLVAAASLEDEILFARNVIVLWAGDGMLSSKMVQEEGYDLFEMGWHYLNLLADRYLIEPMMRDHDGRVVCFRIHDELRSLAIQIAQKQENFYNSVGGNPTVLGNDCSGKTRIFLSHNESLDQSLEGRQFCSLSISKNSVLKEIPVKVLGSMSSLKFLDLSWTAVQSLPETLGKLKQLLCLRLMGMPIKTLPESLTTLVNLEIFDLSFSSITELPSGLDMLKSLRYLGLSHCKDLEYLPRSISALTSLQYLHMIECQSLWKNAEGRECKKGASNSLWTNAGLCKRKKVARISDLGKLSKVKWLELQNNGQTFDEKALGEMAEVETLRLTLTNMKNLPSSIGEMSKLKRLALKCPDLNKIEYSHVRNKKFEEYFQNLNCLILFKCDKLVTLPDLHKLRTLQRLEIIICRKVREFPEAFGEAGAFSSLKIFSVVRLEKLEKLPEIKDEAMPNLQIFTIMECPVLEGLSKEYLKLRTLQKLRIYSCPKLVEVVEKWTEVREPNMKKMVKLMSIRDTEEIKKWHFQLWVKHGSWVYGELWCNEFFLFLGGLDTFL